MCGLKKGNEEKWVGGRRELSKRWWVKERKWGKVNRFKKGNEEMWVG